MQAVDQPDLGRDVQHVALTTMRNGVARRPADQVALPGVGQAGTVSSADAAGRRPAGQHVLAGAGVRDQGRRHPTDHARPRYHQPRPPGRPRRPSGPRPGGPGRRRPATAEVVAVARKVAIQAVIVSAVDAMAAPPSGVRPGPDDGGARPGCRRARRCRPERGQRGTAMRGPVPGGPDAAGPPSVRRSGSTPVDSPAAPGGAGQAAGPFGLMRTDRAARRWRPGYRRRSCDPWRPARTSRPRTPSTPALGHPGAGVGGGVVRRVAVVGDLLGPVGALRRAEQRLADAAAPHRQGVRGDRRPGSRRHAPLRVDACLSRLEQVQGVTSPSARNLPVWRRLQVDRHGRPYSTTRWAQPSGCSLGGAPTRAPGQPWCRSSSAARRRSRPGRFPRARRQRPSGSSSGAPLRDIAFGSTITVGPRMPSGP